MSIIITVLIVLIPLIVGLVITFKNRLPMLIVSAGGQNQKIWSFRVPWCYFKRHYYSLGKIVTNGSTINLRDFSFVALFKGISLNPFGYLDGTRALCKKVKNTQEEIKRGDILILPIIGGPNMDNPKVRVCLGYWGDPNEPDDDLIKTEKYYGPVENFFSTVSPEKYGHEPYKGQIQGYLKTLTGNVDGETHKVSRPHSPETIIGRMVYAF